MSDLDDKIREILETLAVKNTTREHPSLVGDELVAIKQAFSEAGYITPEQVAKTQELVNQMANLAQHMARLPVTVERIGTMTGQEWYDRFNAELTSQTNVKTQFSWLEIMIAAKKAAGIDK